MKKSLIAIAALAAAGAAAAQSSVTMYGQVNTGYEHSKTDITIGGEKTTTKTTGFQNDRVNTSRLGFKGEEALGNGLSAIFALEMGFNASNGEFGGQEKDEHGFQKGAAAFNRRAVVGLKGAFGEVRIGKDSTPMNEFDGSFKAIDRTVSLAQIDVNNDGEDDLDAAFTARPTGLFYNGTFSGVNVSAAIGNDSERTKIAGVTEAKQDAAVYGLGLGYNGGAWAVGAAFQHETKKGFDNTVAPVAAHDGKVTNYGVGASYDFTVAKLYGQYKGGQYKNKASTVADKYSYDQFAVGVSAPFGATTLSAEYAYNKAKDTAGAVSTKYKGNVFAVQAEYAFSKRTSLVARAGQVANWKNETTNDKSSTQEYTVGLRHKF